MPVAHRKRGLASSRRRVDDEGDEDDGLDLNSDSHSEGSILSGTDDLETSDLSEVDEGEEQELEKDAAAGANEEAHVPTIASQDTAAVEQAPAESKRLEQHFVHTADTEAMMVGLKLEEGAEDQEAVHFDDQEKLAQDAAHMGDAPATTVSQGPRQRETVGQRRAREHEEYKARREADPAFVPNRGGFFMHDQRHNQFGPGIQAQMGRGRGRGVPPIGVVGAMRYLMQPYSMSHAANTYLARAQPVRPAMDKWTHDLHETVVAPRPSDFKSQPQIAPRQQSASFQPTFPSKTNVLGNVMLKISLPEKRSEEKSVKMTAKQHTRLPDLRPPLRRDKPVRIFLPGQNARYVFPSVERSFIFIPRAQRSSHSLGRPHSRVYSAHSGDRRQSMLNGSIYAPSAASRRSSVLQEITPTSETGAMNLSQPVVHLPANKLAQSTSDMSDLPHLLPAMQEQPHPPPSQPLRHEARRTSLPMHQPRPQKQVSLATIDSPNAMPALQAQEQMPFHQQVPNHVSSSNSTETAVDRRQSFQGQIPAVTPLSSIPEVAINAQPFQPGHVAQQGYYPAQFPLQYYYQQPDAGQYPSLGYDPQGGYYVPLDAHGPGQPMDSAAMSADAPYMHESNGMVYYYDPNLYAGATNNQGFAVPQQFATDIYSYGQPQPSMMYYPSQ